MKIMALRSLVIPYSQRHFATNKKKHTHKQNDCMISSTWSSKSMNYYFCVLSSDLNFLALLLVTHKYLQINEGREKNANEWWKEVDLLNWQCCSKNTIVEEFANHKEEEKKEIDSNKQSTRWKNAILKKLGWSIRWKKWCYLMKRPFQETKHKMKKCCFDKA